MAAPSNVVELVKVENAVSAILQLLGATGVKKSLFPDEEAIYLSVTLKQMPSIKYGNWKGFSVTLPHSPYQDTASVCLFVKDINQKRNVIDDEITIRYYRELLESYGITSISEIIPIHTLQTEYKPFEAKRKLALSYDFFLADARIFGYLPALLGKEFKKRKRFPLKVSIQKLSSDVSKSLRKSQFLLSSTTATSQLAVGHYNQQKNQVVKNVVAACKQLHSIIPGGWSNINTLHIKSKSTMSLPVYIATDFSVTTNEKKRKPDVPKIKPEEVSTVLKGKVVVYPSGKTKIVQDENEGDASDDEDDDDPDKNETEKKNKADSNSESESETDDELAHIEDKHVAKRLRIESLEPTNEIEETMKSADKPIQNEETKKCDAKQKYQDKKTDIFKKKKLEKLNIHAKKTASQSNAASHRVNKKNFPNKSSKTKGRYNFKRNRKQQTVNNGFKRK